MATPLTCSALLAEVLFTQDGVISRQQAIDCGASEGLLRNMLRRGAWIRLHPGVYVNHNGPLTWRQRAWAAVLGAPGSALSHRSALTIAGLGRPGATIHIAVDRKAHAPERAGVVVHRCAQLTQRVAGGMHPPRVRVEHAVLDVAGEAPSEVDAIAVLADAVRERLTTASRLHSALDSRQWCKRRRLISGVLTDLNEGSRHFGVDQASSSATRSSAATRLPLTSRASGAPSAVTYSAAAAGSATCSTSP